VEKKSVLSNSIYNIGSNIVKILFPMLTIPYISRVLGPTNLGKINFIRSIIIYFVTLAGLGIPFYANREIAKVKENKLLMSETFFDIFFIKIVLSLFFEVVFVFLIFKFPSIINYNTKLALILSLLIIAEMFKTRWFFQGIERFDWLYKAMMFSKIVNIILIFTFIKEQQDFLIYAFIIIITLFLNNLFLFVKAFKTVELKRVSINFFRIKKHFKGIGWLFFAQMAILVYTHLDTVMIGYIQSEADVGQYTVVNRLVRVLMPVFVSISAVLLPRISLLREKNKIKEIENYLSKSISLVLLVGIPAVSGLNILSYEIIHYIFGQQYYSYFALNILSFLLIVIGLNNVFGLQILLPFNEEKKFSLIIIFSAFVNFLLNIILIKKFSFYGAAFATVLAEFIILCLEILVSRKYFSNLFNFKEIAKVLLANSLMLTFVYITKTIFFQKFNFIISFILIIIIASIIYFGLLYIENHKTFKWFIEEKILNKMF